MGTLGEPHWMRSGAQRLTAAHPDVFSQFTHGPRGPQSFPSAASHNGCPETNIWSPAAGSVGAALVSGDCKGHIRPPDSPTSLKFLVSVGGCSMATLRHMGGNILSNGVIGSHLFWITQKLPPGNVKLLMAQEPP